MHVGISNFLTNNWNIGKSFLTAESFDGWIWCIRISICIFGGRLFSTDKQSCVEKWEFGSSQLFLWIKRKIFFIPDLIWSIFGGNWLCSTDKQSCHGSTWEFWISQLIFWIQEILIFLFGAFVTETSYVRPIKKAAVEARGNFDFLN